LDRLETELGLGGLRPSASERALEMAARLRDRTGWWRDSYNADPVGTCQRLLHDRDTLMLWGWSGEPAGPPPAGLWAAPQPASPGLPDRLRAVHAALAAGRPVDIDSVSVFSPLASLPPAWAAVFAALRAPGVTVTELEPEKATPTGDLARARLSPF